MKRNRWSGKWVCVGVIALLAATVFAGCSKGGGSSSPSGATASVSPSSSSSSSSVASSEAPAQNGLEDYTDEMKITAYQGTNYAGPSDGPKTAFAKYVKERFKINVDGFTWSAGEDGAKKISLFAASGDMPDIIQYGNNPAFNQMADAGMLLDVEPYLRNSPNVMRYLNEQIIDSYRNPADGKLYVIPGFTINPELKDEMKPAANNILMVREDWLQKLGLNVPSTPDELYEVLKAFKTLPGVDGNPVIPYLPQYGGQINYHIGAMFGIAKYREATIENEQRMLDYHETPEYLAYLQYASRLFREGLIYPEAYKIDWQKGYNELIPGGTVGLAGMWPGDIKGLNDRLVDTVPEGRYVPIPLPKASGVGDSQMERINTLGYSVIAISQKVSDPERLFKYLDWMSTREGWATMLFGPPSQEEGMWYIDGDGKYVNNQEVSEAKSAENPRWSTDVRGSWSYGLTAIAKYTSDMVLDVYPPLEELRALAREQYKNEIFMDTAYDVFKNETPGPVRTAKGVDVDKILEENEARIIMNAKDDAEVEKLYNSMMDQAMKAGFIDVMKEDYSRFMRIKNGG